MYVCIIYVYTEQKGAEDWTLGQPSVEQTLFVESLPLTVVQCFLLDKYDVIHLIVHGETICVDHS